MFDLRFVLQGMNDLSVYNETEEIRPSNPFLHNQRKENSVLDIALQVMATVTARKAPRELLPFISVCGLGIGLKGKGILKSIDTYTCLA